MSRHNVASTSVATIAAHLGARLVVSGVDSDTAGALVVTGVTQDSRDCTVGDLYCCVVGEHFDGHDFVDDAVARGAVAVVTQRELTSIPPSVAQIVVSDVRVVLGPLARLWWGSSADALRLIGVTGTNGKTSTCAILASILTASGEQCEVVGTLTGVHTTPEALDLYAHLATCHQRGVTTVVMEVSSHALALHRVDGLTFERAVFTNLGRDHLDFHGTDDNYFAAKARLFTSELAKVGVINGDDARGRQLLDGAAIETVRYRSDELRTVVIATDHVSFEWRGIPISVNVGGRFTVMNALAAVVTASSMGVPTDALQRGCAAVTAIDGRFQHIPNMCGLDVVVDFAHTPEALEALLLSAREVTNGRLIVVFGCGGDRDPGKRALMGSVAHTFADEVYVTSDNPRNEDPDAIIAQVRAGISQVRADNRGDGEHVHSIVDRREAIESAISRAKHGDMVVIAGKGHEKTQEIAGVFLPFNDAEIAEAALAAKARREREPGA